MKFVWILLDIVVMYLVLVTISAVTFHMMSHGNLQWSDAFEAALLANLFKTIAVRVHHAVVARLKGKSYEGRLAGCATRRDDEQLPPSRHAA